MRNLVALLGLAVALLGTGLARASSPQLWAVQSPEHKQTYAYGSERHRQWVQRGRHLGIVMDFTNDPYVDVDEPREYDDFVFDFPNVTLGPDGRTFYYHAPGGPSVPVAIKRHGLFGAEITLLPANFLVVQKPHGLLSLTLIVRHHPLATAEN